MFPDNFDSKAAAVALELLRDIPEKDQEFPVSLEDVVRRYPTRTSQEEGLEREKKRLRHREDEKNGHYLLAMILYRMTQHIAAELNRVIENPGGRIHQFTATKALGDHKKRVIPAIPNPNKITFQS